MFRHLKNFLKQNPASRRNFTDSLSLENRDADVYPSRYISNPAGFANVSHFEQSIPGTLSILNR